MDRSWLRRAATWTLALGGLVVQGWLLTRYASDAMAAFIADPDRYGGRWWHRSEPFLAVAGYALLVLTTTLLALAWTKALRTPPAKPDDDADADGADEDDEPEVAIDIPAFLKPKTRRVRRGAGALAGFTALALLLLAAGVALGVVESFQLYEVLKRNPGRPGALHLNSTVWIQRLMLWIAPAVQTLGAVLLGFTWGRYLPLPPAEDVVVGEPAPQAVAATPARAEWQTFD